jgi:acetylornithine/succinyldiaminopimelate/putrescine aminotransferase
VFFKSKKSSKEKQGAIALFSNYVSSGKVRFFKKYKMDFVMGARAGSVLHDLDANKSLFNLHCNGGVFNLGHRHKEIVETLKLQLDHLDIGNHHLLSKYRAELAKLLADLMPGDLSYTVFGVSGGEAIDLAIKVARGYTQRKQVISARGGYHGHTGLSIQAGDKQYRDLFQLDSEDFVQVPYNDFGALEKVMNEDTAAVLLETVPATLGMPLPADGYLAKIKKLCQEQGALLILDEVQSGLGRTGKLWAFEHFNVQPDMVVLGKGLSGGIYPMSATVIDKRLETVFHKDPFIHVSTFGGAELGCTVAMKVLQISSATDFLDHVNLLSEKLIMALEDLQLKHRSVFKGVHGLGLMLALELGDELAGPVLTKTAYDNDLLMIYANNNTSRVQFLPPLTIDEGDIPQVMDQLDKALKKLKFLLPIVRAKRAIGSFIQG